MPSLTAAAAALEAERAGETGQGDWAIFWLFNRHNQVRTRRAVPHWVPSPPGAGRQPPPANVANVLCAVLQLGGAVLPSYAAPSCRPPASNRRSEALLRGRGGVIALRWQVNLRLGKHAFPTADACPACRSGAAASAHLPPPMPLDAQAVRACIRVRRFALASRTSQPRAAAAASICRRDWALPCPHLHRPLA